MANYEHNRKVRKEFDGTLDAVLAHYASVEPREGMEERILANLRAAEPRVEQRTWWSWAFAAALAAILMIAGALVWRWNNATQPPVANHAPTVQAPAAPDLVCGNEHNAPPRKSVQHRAPRPHAEDERVAGGPKLDVFPSPLPLSEQEKILAGYIAQYPEHAALVAEARMDALRREDEERRRIAGERDESQ